MRSAQGETREAGMGQRYCDVGDCLRLAERDGKCRGHRAREHRGAPVGEPLREPLDPWSLLHKAAIEVRDASSEDDLEYRRAADRLRYAARRYGCEGCDGRGCDRKARG